MKSFTKTLENINANNTREKKWSYYLGRIYTQPYVLGDPITFKYYYGKASSRGIGTNKVIISYNY